MAWRIGVLRETLDNSPSLSLSLWIDDFIGVSPRIEIDLKMASFHGHTSLKVASSRFFFFFFRSGFVVGVSDKYRDFELEDRPRNWIVSISLFRGKIRKNPPRYFTDFDARIARDLVLSISWCMIVLLSSSCSYSNVFNLRNDLIAQLQLVCRHS